MGGPLVHRRRQTAAGVYATARLAAFPILLMSEIGVLAGQLW
jgi:hypothetical protein